MSRLKYFKDLWVITKKTAAAWFEADPFRQSAVIAYYAIFSIPALLVIIITVVGFVFGREAVQGEITAQIGNAIEHDTAKEVEAMIAKASERKGSVWAAIISVITLIFGSTGVFAQLQTSLNQIWEVKVSDEKLWLKALRDRLFSFGLVLSIAFLLLVSLVVSAALSSFGEWIRTRLPEFILVLFRWLNFIISFGVITLLFSLMFKILPDAKIKWKNVWIGAMVTSMLFTIGKSALGFYFAKSDPASTYGAAGSVVLIMLWVSYSCMILFFGAEFTKQYSVHYNGGIKPKADAELIEPDENKRVIGDKKKVVEKVEEDDKAG